MRKTQHFFRKRAALGAALRANVSPADKQWEYGRNHTHRKKQNCFFTGSPPPKIHFHSLPAPKILLHRLPAPKNYPSQAPCRKKCSFTASPLHKNTLSQPCINLLVGTISFRSLGEHSLVGTFAFLHSDHWSEISLLAHWAQISLSVHWAEISLRQHRLIEQLSSPR